MIGSNFGSKWLISGLAGLAVLAAAAPAGALDVPPYRGNDTGGIIAWEYSKTVDVRALAADHCARYDKMPRFVSADRRYGGYISFHCRWVRPASYLRPIRTLY